MAAPKNDAKKETQEVEVAKETAVKAVKEIAPAPEKEQPAKRKKLDRTDEVACRCVTEGELTYISRRNGFMTIEWAGYGDVQFVEIGELMNMKSSQSKFLMHPWLIIDDEDVVEYLGLKRMYDELIPLEDVENFIVTSTLEELTNAAKKSPKGIQKLLIDKARKLVKTRELYDNRKIEALSQVLNVDLNMIV